jgi:hypothetical protein
MYLLNVRTLALENVQDERSQPYAILSHVWLKPGDLEVNFADIREQTNHTSKAGYRKVRYACQQARRDRIPYVWIDTCCINSASEPERHEAIRSMYAWYAAARVCYAYLGDLAPTRIPGDRPDDLYWTSRLKSCNWFRRGW